MSERPIVAITEGDPAGIGPEIIVKALADPAVYESCKPLVIADARHLEQALGFCGIEGIAQDTLLIRLDMAGFAVSAGSACSAGSLEPSHVLKAMGQTPEQAASALRVTLGRFTTKDELEGLLTVLQQAVTAIRGQAGS